MSDKKQLPYIIQLLDDESEDTQKEILKQLLLYGPNLKQDLFSLDSALLESRQHLLDLVFKECQRVWLRNQWLHCFSYKENHQCLEEALKLLSEYLSGLLYSESLGSLLDDLVSEFNDNYKDGSVADLARFLFKEKQFKGNEHDYYNPQNSNVIFTIKEGLGLPITLVCIYILTAKRLGLNVEGFNFPGHFMARIEEKSKKILVDCFHGGNFIDEEDWVHFSSVSKSVMDITERIATDEDIVMRVLVNLIHAYQISNNESDKHFIMNLFNELDDYLKNRDFLKGASDSGTKAQTTLFKPGNFVTHQLYGYRGLIVSGDKNCKADDNWYFSNRTQPDRNQPWYHILVHESEGVTYAAQSNLVARKIDKDFKHPLVEYFFEISKDGQYIRNNVPWPEN